MSSLNPVHRTITDGRGFPVGADEVHQDLVRPGSHLESPRPGETSRQPWAPASGGSDPSKRSADLDSVVVEEEDHGRYLCSAGEKWRCRRDSNPDEQTCRVSRLTVRPRHPTFLPSYLLPSSVALLVGSRPPSSVCSRPICAFGWSHDHSLPASSSQTRSSRIKRLTVAEITRLGLSDSVSTCPAKTSMSIERVTPGNRSNTISIASVGAGRTSAGRRVLRPNPSGRAVRVTCSRNSSGGASRSSTRTARRAWSFSISASRPAMSFRNIEIERSARLMRCSAHRTTGLVKTCTPPVKEMASHPTDHKVRNMTMQGRATMLA